MRFVWSWIIVMVCGASACQGRAGIRVTVGGTVGSARLQFASCTQSGADPAVFLLDVVRMEGSKKTQWCSALAEGGGASLGRSWTYGARAEGITVEECRQLAPGDYMVAVRGHKGGGRGDTKFSVTPAGTIMQGQKSCD